MSMAQCNMKIIVMISFCSVMLNLSHFTVGANLRGFDLSMAMKGFLESNEEYSGLKEIGSGAFDAEAKVNEIRRNSGSQNVRCGKKQKAVYYWIQQTVNGETIKQKRMKCVKAHNG